MNLSDVFPYAFLKDGDLHVYEIDIHPENNHNVIVAYTNGDRFSRRFPKHTVWIGKEIPLPDPQPPHTRISVF